MRRITINTLHSGHLVKANTSIFNKEIASIEAKLKKFAESISGIYYGMHPEGNPQTSPAIVLAGKIETDAEYKEIMKNIDKIFNVVSTIDVKEDEESEDFDTTVVVCNENGLTVILRVPKDYFKIQFEIYVPIIIEPGMVAKKDDTTIIYKHLSPVTVKRVMRVGNTVVVPLKRELDAIGNPDEVEVYLNVENSEVVIKPKH